MTLTWRSREPTGLALALLHAGFRQTGAGAAALFECSGVHLRLVPAEPGEDDALVAAHDPVRGPDRRTTRLPAVGWATVDAGRLGRGWAVELRPLAGDALLGADAWLAVGISPATVLLEPATEGRLAAALARHGEGPIAIYAAAAGQEPPGSAIGTPFGAGALAGLPPRWGPFLVLVSTPARRVPSAR